MPTYRRRCLTDLTSGYMRRGGRVSASSFYLLLRIPSDQGPAYAGGVGGVSGTTLGTLC